MLNAPTATFPSSCQSVEIATPVAFRERQSLDSQWVLTSPEAYWWDIVSWQVARFLALCSTPTSTLYGSAGNQWSPCKQAFCSTGMLANRAESQKSRWPYCFIDTYREVKPTSTNCTYRPSQNIIKNKKQHQPHITLAAHTDVTATYSNLSCHLPCLSFEPAEADGATDVLSFTKFGSWTKARDAACSLNSCALF